MNKMNKKGVSGGIIILIAVALVLVWTQTTFFQDLLGEGPEPEIPGQCPSSGLTEVTINTQEALASTATNANHEYFVFDSSGVLVKNGESGSDGQSVFDVGCGVNKEYNAIVLNDSTNSATAGSTSGFYAETFTIEASGPVFSENLQVYEYGTLDISNIGSDADPAGTANISSGIGKSCGFTITFTVNESASAYNKPLILCQANNTGVTDITMNGVTEVPNKRPTRISVKQSVNDWWVFELDKLVKSTDAAQKVSGKIQFSNSVTPALIGNMTCQIADQATYKKADYKTLSLSEGFVEAAQDDSNSDVGAPDSDEAVISFSHGSGYC